MILMKMRRLSWFIVPVLLLFLAAGFYFFASVDNKNFIISSIEVGFTSLSPSGILGGFAIPASCPSFVHFAGECDPPTVDLVAPAQVIVPNPIPLSWTTTGVGVSCTASGNWSGPKPAFEFDNIMIF